MRDGQIVQAGKLKQTALDEGRQSRRFCIVLGDAQNMAEVPDRSVQLVVTSPPYFNAPFDRETTLRLGVIAQINDFQRNAVIGFIIP